VRVQELFDLTGRTALVTGGGRGIGRHIAIGLAEAGADLVLASRRVARCEEVAREVESLGRRAWAIEVDLADEASVAALADRVDDEVGCLDILVNNAGAIWGAPVLDYPLAGWDKVFDVNVRGLWQLSQRVARRMAERGGGCILHIASIAGLRGAVDEKEPSVAYAAAKGAVVSLTKDMAIKLARHHIRVNCISPGAFDTDMLDHVRGSEERLAGFLAQIPMNRAGGEDDVKAAAVFLCSDAAAYVTGHNLVLDGGWLAAG
jgi:gluconate 5-dehydrogenase